MKKLKKALLIFFPVLILFQFINIKSHIIYVVGPISEQENWHKNAKRVFKYLQQKYNKETFSIYPQLNKTNKLPSEKNLSEFYLADQSSLCDGLAKKILKTYKDEKKTINIACYGRGIDVTLGAIIKIKDVIKKNSSQITLNNLLNLNDNGTPENVFYKPSQPMIPYSISHWQSLGGNTLSSNSSGTHSSYSSEDSDSGNENDYSDSTDEITITSPNKQTLQMLQFNNLITEQQVAHYTRMAKLMGKVDGKELDEYHGANSNLKVILKIVTVTGGTIGGVCGATMATATAVTTVAGLGIAVIALL